LHLLSFKEHAWLYYLIIISTSIRVFVAPFFDLGVDEAHYAIYAQELALSYFDHPPLIGWVQYLFASIFGYNSLGLRLSAILVGVITTYFLYLLLFLISKDKKISFIATLSLSSMMMFNALFLMSMPDTLLFVLIIPIILTTIKVYEEPNLNRWLMLGLLLGLAGLSKYTAVLFIVPIVLFFSIKRDFSFFKKIDFYLAIVLALLLISPVLIWNIQNDFISFTYQSEHVVGAQSIKPYLFFKSLVTQLIAYNPFISCIAYYGLYRAIKSKDDYLFLSALFGLTLVLFFAYASLYKLALPHWSALFYMLFVPIGVYFLLLKQSLKINKYLNFSIIFGILLSLVIYFELVFKVIAFPDYKSLHRDIYGFDTILKEANSFVVDANKTALAVNNWTLASRAIYYNSTYNSKMFLIDKRYDQFDIWQDVDAKGYDLIFISTHDFKVDINTYKCDSTKMLKSFDIVLNEKKVNTIKLLECKNFQGKK